MPRPPKHPIPTPRAARLLGVTASHLGRVLNGHRESKRLTSRYHALVHLEKNKAN